jgi:hypothetical protein
VQTATWTSKTLATQGPTCTRPTPLDVFHCYHAIIYAVLLLLLLLHTPCACALLRFPPTITMHRTAQHHTRQQARCTLPLARARRRQHMDPAAQGPAARPGLPSTSNSLGMRQQAGCKLPTGRARRRQHIDQPTCTKASCSSRSACCWASLSASCCSMCTRSPFQLLAVWDLRQQHKQSSYPPAGFLVQHQAVLGVR